MNAVKKVFSEQPIYFVCGLLIFIIAAVLGWNKLQYGFNFIDEGYHMTESWRLAAGDHFLKDKFTGALRHYTLINSLIFRACPDITLVGFRKLQYFLTIFSLILLSVALYIFNKQYWYQPLIFSLFAFTGLDPIGMISNLYYQTYPHLFITLHLSCILFGLHAQKIFIKRMLFLLSGLCLWCMSLSLLHLSVIAVSPILLYIFSRKLKPSSFSFSFHDLCYVLAPFIICWTVFIAIYNGPYVLNVISSLEVMLSSAGHSPTDLVNINWVAIKYTSISALFIILFFFLSNKFHRWISIICLSALSLLMYFIIDTSLFGLITPYYNGWFAHPMWLNSMLISFTVLFWLYITSKYFIKRELSMEVEVAIILLTPFSIMALAMSIFSGLGVLSILQCSIPAVVAIAVVIIYDKKIYKQPYAIKLFILVLLFAPFYYTTAWSDWRFTFFDVSPAHANATIEEGFGKGIRTNRVYKNLYNWIRITTEKHSNENDFIISYVVSPMVHMIAKRRPALDDSFITFAELPINYYEKSITLMKERHRHPKLAFVFESMPALTPISLKEGKYGWFGKEFVFSSQSKDPISRYVLENMELVDEFKLTKDNKVRCFVDSRIINQDTDSMIAEIRKEIKLNPLDPVLHNRLGILYQARGMLDKAVEHYREALSIHPDFTQALNNLSLTYMKKGDYENALSSLKRMIELNPDSVAAHYNMACLYAKQDRKEASVAWLKRAVGLGFNDWGLLKTDMDLKNIRDTLYYYELLENITEK